MKKIGLFDSGLGGLTVLREVRKLVPADHYLYLGDTARVPYGTKSPETVVRYARECTRFLLSNDVDQIIVACNTASSVALTTLRNELSVPISGTIDATARAALQATKKKRIGVIGTQGTVRSGAFENILRMDEDCSVFSLACPLFVPLVEEGLFEGDLVDKVISHYLSALKERDIDTLILGCTHYPMLKESLGKFFGPAVKLISSSEAVAEELRNSMPTSKLKDAKTGGPVSICITDTTPGFHDFAAKILGDLEDVECSKVELEITA